MSDLVKPQESSMQESIIYLSPAEASRVLTVTPATIRLMVRRGDLKVAAMTEGGMRLFERAEVERVAQRRASQGKEAVHNGKEAR